MTAGLSTSTSPRRLAEGHTFVWGKSPAMARELLDAAVAVSVDPMEVRAVSNGFIVPDAVWDHVAQPDPPDGEF